MMNWSGEQAINFFDIWGNYENAVDYWSWTAWDIS